MPAAHYVHPEFGLLCPTPRLRRRLRIVFACMILAWIGGRQCSSERQFFERQFSEHHDRRGPQGKRCEKPRRWAGADRRSRPATEPARSR